MYVYTGTLVGLVLCLVKVGGSSRKTEDGPLGMGADSVGV